MKPSDKFIHVDISIPESPISAPGCTTFEWWFPYELEVIDACSSCLKRYQIICIPLSQPINSLCFSEEEILNEQFLKTEAK